MIDKNHIISNIKNEFEYAEYIYKVLTKASPPYLCEDVLKLSFRYLSRKSRKWKKDKNYKKIKKVFFTPILNYIKKKKIFDSLSPFMVNLVNQLKNNKFDIIKLVLTNLAPKLLMLTL